MMQIPAAQGPDAIYKYITNIQIAFCWKLHNLFRIESKRHGMGFSPPPPSLSSSSSSSSPHPPDLTSTTLRLPLFGRKMMICENLPSENRLGYLSCFRAQFIFAIFLVEKIQEQHQQFQH